MLFFTVAAAKKHASKHSAFIGLGGVGVVGEVKHHFAGLCYFKSGW